MMDGTYICIKWLYEFIACNICFKSGRKQSIQLEVLKASPLQYSITYRLAIDLNFSSKRLIFCIAYSMSDCSFMQSENEKSGARCKIVFILASFSSKPAFTSPASIRCCICFLSCSVLVSVIDERTELISFSNWIILLRKSDLVLRYVVQED